MDAALHRIEPLAGDGRYAITFRRPDGSEQMAVAHLTDTGLDVAEASLPTGWSRSSAVFDAVAAAVLAFDTARRFAPSGPTLHDVAGGWDVSLGNVVLDDAGQPTCIAHGPMTDDASAFECPECGARAALT